MDKMWSSVYAIIIAVLIFVILEVTNVFAFKLSILYICVFIVLVLILYALFSFVIFRYLKFKSLRNIPKMNVNPKELKNYSINSEKTESPIPQDIKENKIEEPQAKALPTEKVDEPEVKKEVVPDAKVEEHHELVKENIEEPMIVEQPKETPKTMNISDLPEVKEPEPIKREIPQQDMSINNSPDIKEEPKTEEKIKKEEKSSFIKLSKFKELEK